MHMIAKNWIDWKGLASFWLDWHTVNWKGFDWIMLKRIKWEGAFGISNIGLDWIGLVRIGLECIGLEWDDLERSWFKWINF